MKRKLFLSALALFPMLVTQAQTSQQSDNLYTFARLYGYVRYFHPSDANVVMDWDKFAIYGARAVEKAGSKKELQQILEQLFKPIAPSLSIYDTGAEPAFNLKDIMPPDTAGMKVVAWQHTGYGAGSNNRTYRSMRTNSYMKGIAPWSQFNFSTITGGLNATPYRGRMIRYTAALKAENLENGTGQLWLRVDREDRRMGFFDNMDSRPVTGVNKNWRRDTIMGKIDDDAEMVVFGCFITKHGTMLMDDVKMEIQAPGGQWETIKELNGDFEKDKPGAGPDYWKFNPDEKVFSVKITSQQAISGKHALLLQRTTRAKYMESTGTLFPLALQPGTVIKKDIGSGLSITMPVALWGDGQQTWPLTDTMQTVQQNRKMTSELTLPLTANDLYVRVGDVIITWNVFQHFHPYYKEWVTNWDNDLRLALNDCYKNRTVEDFHVTLKTLTAKMRDGHTGVRAPRVTQPAFVPVKWEWVEDKLVVTQILSPGVALQRGDVITAINGQPVKEYIANAGKTVSAGTPNALMDAALSNMAWGAKDSTMVLSVASKGLVNVPFNVNGGEYYRADRPKTPYQKIDSATVYVNLPLMPWTELKEKLPELAKAPVVIFDVRGYPKDMNGQMIITHLMKQPETTKWMQQQMLTLPDHEKTDWTPLGWDLKPAAPHIGGKVFFLTSADAISYAESVMGYIKGMQLGSIIGEPTAGANGDVNTVTLPGGYSFTFTGLKATNHDGSQHYMKGILPDIQVLKTIQGIRENRDEVLDKAVELGRQAARLTVTTGK